MNKTTMNKAHADYLQRLKKEKQNVLLVQIFIFIAFMGLWEVSSNNGWIDPLLFSSPKRIGFLFMEKVNDGSLFPHLGVTLSETFFGFLFGTLLGTLIASLLWWIPFLSKVLDG